MARPPTAVGRYAKPLPTLRGEERTYFDHARRNELVLQECGDCGSRHAYARTVCPRCFSADLMTVTSAGKGTVYSWTTLHRPGTPAFADDVPYTIVLVDLDEGVRVLADLVTDDPGDPSVGMPVRVVFDQVSDEITLPRFVPEGAGRAR